MLKRQVVDTGTIEVTFVLPAKQWTEPVSVVGDFNGWDPLALAPNEFAEFDSVLVA